MGRISKSHARKCKSSATKSKPGATNSKSCRTKSKFKSLDFFRRIEPYQVVTSTPRHFFLFAPLPASNATAAQALLVRPCPSFLFVFVSESSGLMKQVKGWPHFKIADCVLVRRLRRRFRPTWRPRASLRANRGNPGGHGASRVMNPGTEERGKRQGNRSDVRQEYVRSKKSPNRFRAFESGRAPALHASRVSHNACL
jgi:hypothetical protein